MSSKQSRRKEIQKKQDLQAKFQLSILQMNTRVSGWLTLPEKNEPPNDSVEEPLASNPFLELPIIPQGATLSNMNELSTVKDFVQGDGKKPNRIEKDKKLTTSQPMSALLNKIRDDQRRNMATRQKERVIPNTLRIAKTGKSNNKSVAKEEDDSDDEVSNKHGHRAVNKSSGLQFGKKKRPF